MALPPLFELPYSLQPEDTHPTNENSRKLSASPENANSNYVTMGIRGLCVTIGGKE
jgi:hypothetical protein